jgi:tetraacyldisaccharide 4'-kinase
VQARPSSGRIEERLAERGGGLELLRVPASLFGAAVRLRRGAYDRGWLPRVHPGVPVVSVGNLSTGGTGKTPLAAWLVGELARRGFRPGLLSRGYGAPPGGGAPNDEALLLARLCPGVPHVQDKDRVRGARALVARGADAIVLDDGFQHRRLARDVDLVLIDATRPYGLPAPKQGGAPVEALLPRGLLREPSTSLARADAIVVTRSDALSASELEALEAELARVAPGKGLVRAVHRARRLRDERGIEHPLARLAGREVELASAIGNPRAFEADVRALGARVLDHRVFPDHHRYVASDLEGLGSNGRTLVTTAKDAVKLEPLGVAFEALEVELEIVSGALLVEALLDALPRHGEEPLPLKSTRSLRD